MSEFNPEEDDGFDDYEEPPTPLAARDWIDGSKAISWGRWNPKWPISIMPAIQYWGDNHGIRFILVSEYNDRTTAKITAEDYYLVLYAAPKPNSKATGLCAHSISNRDRNLPSFSAWFEGFRAGRGIYDV